MAPLPNSTSLLTPRFSNYTASSLLARSNSSIELGNSTSIFARGNSTSIFARGNSTSIFARDNSSLLLPTAPSNVALVPRSTATNHVFARSVASGNYTKASRSFHLLARADSTYVPCAGCLDPTKINNKVYFSLFAVLGAAMVVASIWFFFWAKNGGFRYQDGDWDDYKSTVLRRKGPDGKTLYSGTRSTVFNDKGDRIAAKSVIGYDDKGRKGIVAKRGFGGTHSVYYSDDFTDFTGSRADDMSEVMPEKNGRGRIRGGDAAGHHSQRYRDRDLREYKHERPARVGGMNRTADGTQYDYSDRSETMTERSTEPLTNKERKQARAEKRAQDDAARMERKWRKEAERAAQQLARESASESTPKRVASPAARQAHRARRDSRSKSPKKQQRSSRAYSFSGGQDEASTVYSGSQTDTTVRSSSYYDAYRPLTQQTPSPRHHDRHSSSRHSSPTKQKRHYYADSDAGTSDSGARHERRSKPRGGRDVMAGYRRGMASDSE